MTHGDGGKGSARRKENAQAIMNNWDLIFRKKEQPKEAPKESNVVHKDTPTMPKLPKQ